MWALIEMPFLILHGITSTRHGAPVLLGMVVMFGVGSTIYYLSTADTRERETTRAVKHVAMTNCHNPDAVEPMVDAWDTPITVAIDTDENDTLICVARSNGADKRFDTNDDITYTSRNLNKSRLLGKLAAQKVKEFMKGYREEGE